MSLNPEIQAELDLAKGQINNSGISIEGKKSLLNALNYASSATNGLSTEAKIHALSKAIFGVIIVQTLNMIKYDELLSTTASTTTELLKVHTENCPLNKLHTMPEILHTSEATWTNTIQQVLLKPYIYAAASVMVFSPYAFPIIEAVIKAIK